MKKILFSVVILFFIISVTFMAKGIVKKSHARKMISEKIEKLPEVSFLSLSKQVFNSSTISEGPVLIVRFHPECEHCKYEISEVMKSDLPEICTKIILVSSAEPDSITSFLNLIDYRDSPSIITLLDTAWNFGDIFGADFIPSNYIYDKDLKLIKTFNGEVKTETIVKLILGSE